MPSAVISPESATTSEPAQPPSVAPHSLTQAPSYPVNLRLVGRRCLVVGAGQVAIRKIAGLVKSGAAVTVVAPVIRDEIRAIETVALIERVYRSEDLLGHMLVITCTDDSAVNAEVYRDAEVMGIWANSADDPVNCAFTLPAVARAGDLQVTVSTHGRSPALATWLRQRFEREFDATYEVLLQVLSDVRAEVRAERGTSEIVGWSEALDAGVFERVQGGDLDGAKHLLRRHLGLAQR